MAAKTSPLGHAWALHREGRNEQALAEFDRILREAPNDIDANFGLGLTQRALGRFDQAIEAFQKTKQLILKSTQEIGGENRIEDRWAMLLKMCDQRIAETQSAKASQPG